MYLNKKTIGLMLAAMMIAILGGCSAENNPAPNAKPAPDSGDFFILPEVTPEGVTRITMGIQPASGVIQAGQYQMIFELRDADGSLLAKAEGELPSVDADRLVDAVEVLSWESELSPGDYEVTFGSKELGFARVQFVLLEQDGDLLLELLRRD